MVPFSLRTSGGTDEVLDIKKGHVRPRKNLRKKPQIREEEVANYVKSRLKFINRICGLKTYFSAILFSEFKPSREFWANMKRWIKKEIQNFEHLFDSISFFFNYAIST